jgi:nucleotide-binding universal stress UspA family protein
MFKKVMWATDGSEAADQALPAARALAQEDGGELLVVHCEQWTEPFRTGGAYPARPDAEELKAKIEGQVAELSESGLSAKLELAGAGEGGAAHAIAEVAKSRGADVIAVGTRGHTRLAGLVLGSVTERLLHIAPCPLLVVPTKSAGQDS